MHTIPSHRPGMVGWKGIPERAGAGPGAGQQGCSCRGSHPSRGAPSGEVGGLCSEEGRTLLPRQPPPGECRVALPWLPAPLRPPEPSEGPACGRWAGPAPRSMCLAPYTICRAAEQNFLINKQGLGFHVGEAMTEEGLGLSPLSAPGPANSSPPGRASERGRRAWPRAHFWVVESLPGGWPQLLSFPATSSLTLATGDSGLGNHQNPCPVSVST